VTFVIDASVTLAWALEDEPNDYADRIFRRLPDEPAVVSSVWPLEIANGLLVAERRSRVSSAEASRVHAILEDLPIAIDSLSLDIALGPILALARSEDLSAYDASYLELAMREGFPLATVDDRLRAAAVRVGVLPVD
jgi:predicted nucleic acid-binding protein